LKKNLKRDLSSYPRGVPTWAKKNRMGGEHAIKGEKKNKFKQLVDGKVHIASEFYKRMTNRQGVSEKTFDLRNLRKESVHELTGKTFIICKKKRKKRRK